MPNPVRDLGAFIREQRNTSQISLRQLAATAGVSNPYLSQIERGLRKPSAEILQQIAKALRISAEVLYVQAGILEARDEERDVVASITADPVLSEASRTELLGLYLRLRAADAPLTLEPAVGAVIGSDATTDVQTTS